jgi:hypothetical protein
LPLAYYSAGPVGGREGFKGELVYQRPTGASSNMGSGKIARVDEGKEEPITKFSNTPDI